MRHLATLLILAGCASRPAPQPGQWGETIVVCGESFPAGTKVVLWTDPGGFNAESGGSFGRRPGRPDDLDGLRDVVRQVVLHYDVAGTSERCFTVLKKRGLSCHFLLDLDGTIYQTLDVKHRAWHAGEANDRSIGIEIANIGAYRDMSVLNQWYARDASGTYVARPAGANARPARDAPVRGRIHGELLVQYDFTDAQYEALSKLLAALSRALPGITVQAPAERTVLADPERPGYVAHYHLTRNKIDPGPAFDWDRVLSGVRAQPSSSSK